MPAEGVELAPKEDMLTTDEIVRLASLFVRNGTTKIRLTGGEPTLRPDLVPLLERLGALKPLGLRRIGMTSNGLALRRKLPDLVRAGLTDLNISLDTLDEHKFELMTRRRGHGHVMATLDAALDVLPVGSVKLNVVVIRGLNDDEAPSFAALARDRPVTVRFIECVWVLQQLLTPTDTCLSTTMRGRRPSSSRRPSCWSVVAAPDILSWRGHWTVSCRTRRGSGRRRAGRADWASSRA